MNPVIATLFKIVDCLAEQNIEYAVMGGLAVRAHSIPRPTHDVDLTIALSQENLPIWFDKLESMGVTVPEAYRSVWVDKVAGMSLVKLRTYLNPDSTTRKLVNQPDEAVHDQSVDIDIFLAESEFQSSILRRKIQVDVEGRLIWLVAAEDLILLKLIASRPRDLIDISDILFIQGELDQGYMRKWSRSLGIERQLEKVLEESQRHSN